MSNRIIRAAQERISSFDLDFLKEMEDSRPDTVWEKAHTYPISQQNLFNHVDCDPTDWEHAKQIDSPAQVYIHIPWCEERCSFCRYSIDTRDASDERVDPYFSSLEKEIDHTLALLGKNRVTAQTMYIGGGTPSSLQPHQIDKLFKILNGKFDFTPDAFLIAECSPGTITSEKATAFRSNGIGRVSMGVQSFDDDVLKEIRRDHSADSAKKAYGILRSQGFPEVNLDIMLALPGQNYQTFLHTMKEAIKLAPSSLSLLDLHIAPRSPLSAQGFKHNFKTNLVMRAMYQAMMDNTEYVSTRPHYYALPNEMPHPATRCPSMDSRVDGSFQLGFGNSAISHIGDIVTINSLGGAQYAKKINSKGSAVSQGYELTEEDKISMRALRSLNETSFLAGNKEVLGYFKEEIQFMRNNGLMDNHLQLTEDGKLFGSETSFMFYPK